MTNAEFYAEELKKEWGDFCPSFIIPKILEPQGLRCWHRPKEGENDIHCAQCHIVQIKWAMEEHKEPEVDWENVPVDTPILVKQNDGEVWNKRHFAKFKNGQIYAFSNGYTSFTCYGKHVMTEWKYGKLWKGSSEQAMEAKERNEK